VPWAEFNVSFPAGQDLPIQVAYNLNGSGYMPFTAFYYILETGAGWQDTIGSADVTLRLPYEANTQNVILNTQIGWAETTPGGVFNGNELRWHFDNFEPGPDGPVQNMEFALVAPVSWKNVLKERDNVTKKASDSEAWGRLALAYKQILFMSRETRSDAGGEELYQLSIAAYEKCLALNPKDAQWHAGFADLLATHSYLDYSHPGPSADTYRALDEINTALRLAPKDPKVLGIAETLSYQFQDGVIKNGDTYDFPWLTQTPTPLPPPSQTPVVPTQPVVIHDPAAVSGVYQSDLLTLGNQKKLQLTLTLHPDYTAEFESKYENETPVIYSGSWTDSKNGTLFINTVAPNKAVTVINSIVVGKDALQISGYSPYYGDPALNFSMKRLITATPEAGPTNTPAAPASTSAPAAGTSTPAPAASLPFCGSAALPLIGLLWLARKRS